VVNSTSLQLIHILTERYHPISHEHFCNFRYEDKSSIFPVTKTMKHHKISSQIARKKRSEAFEKCFFYIFVNNVHWFVWFFTFDCLISFCRGRLEIRIFVNIWFCITTKNINSVWNNSYWICISTRAYVRAYEEPLHFIKEIQLLQKRYPTEKLFWKETEGKKSLSNVIP
jgi:uncharacterized membrane protein (DUF485 family)